MDKEQVAMFHVALKLVSDCKEYAESEEATQEEVNERYETAKKALNEATNEWKQTENYKKTVAELLDGGKMEGDVEYLTDFCFKSTISRFRFDECGIVFYIDDGARVVWKELLYDDFEDRVKKGAEKGKNLVEKTVKCVTDRFLGLEKTQKLKRGKDGKMHKDGKPEDNIVLVLAEDLGSGYIIEE